MSAHYDRLALLLAILLLMPCALEAQRKKKRGAQAKEKMTFDASYYDALKWRNIGPFRGGRSTTVCGVIQDPNTFYMGATGGGVWKTVDGGHSWKNISDGFFRTGSVGAIAVAPSDPNVIYVGMGESCIRGVMTSSGDGVYKSTDAGVTWEHIGLDETRQISEIEIDPQNPDMVFVAAQGSPYKPSDARGIFKSVDGGERWKKVLFVDASSGASDLSLDTRNPRVLYAAFWDHQRLPWTMRSGGPGSGIWKSTDAGENWQELSQGLPDSIMGKIGIVVSPANGNRVYAIIESKQGGLYRSDDAGKKWKLINADRVLRARSWYYMHIFADPQNQDAVYVLNAPMMRSRDGGKTFRRIMTPHGDNHDLWIHPDQPKTMINANDGGANISYNGGVTWSTQSNQPTAQFYRVNADNQFPYHVYGGQQDNSTVAIPNAVTGRGISNRDFYPVGGCESAYCAFDPDNPRFVYAGCYQGIITEYDTRLKTGKDIMAYPDLGLGKRPKDMKFRHNWNAPILVSRHDPQTIYHAGNILMRSTDRGLSWNAISDDLTYNTSEKLDWGGGPITNEAAGGENYHTIMAVCESPSDAEELWVGTDDGLVHFTRDGGENWENITPDDVTDGIINTIELTATPGTAYLAVTRYKFDDFSPYVYVTHDYGANWKRRDHGISKNAHVRVVRADPDNSGLLFAGTERGLFISFDEGLQWHAFQLNLPVVPITDMMIHQGDLIVATQGRSFWILDNYSVLKHSGKKSATDVQLFPCEDVVQWGGPRIDTLSALGTNPDQGVVAFVHLPESRISSEFRVLDKRGETLRSLKSDAGKKQDKLKLQTGLNKIVWNFRRNSFDGPKGIMTFGGTKGTRIGPGTYTLQFIHGGDTSIQTVRVLDDPRRDIPQAEHVEKQALLTNLADATQRVFDLVKDMRYVKQQINAFQERKNLDSTLIKKGQVINKTLDSLELELVQSKQKTFQDVINFPNQLDAKLMHIQGIIDSSYPPLTAGQKTRARDLLSEVNGHEKEVRKYLRSAVSQYNTSIAEQKIDFISPVSPESQKRKGKT